MESSNADRTDEQLIDTLVEYYKGKQDIIRSALDSLHVYISAAFAKMPLSDLVHSVKRRVKDPDHLKDKLLRKLADCRKEKIKFDYDENSLFSNVTDLAGYRILHLHTLQLAPIHEELLKVFDEASWDLHQPPFGHVWDQETAAFLESIKIKAEFNPRLYSSVHYVLRARAKSLVTCEVQVRTLADEIWGEIDHKINYPEPHASLACREQIKALARVASSCSRLVDSIMLTHDDYMKGPAGKD
jgi:putative GTP pyrophosphokinase